MSSRIAVLVGVLAVAACNNPVDTPSVAPTPSGTGTGAQAPLPSPPPGETLLQLAWQPNQDGVVAGYRVYFGPSGDEATTQASDFALTATNFNPQAPAVIYNAQRDLGLVAGQNVCFRLRAYSDQGTLSAWSAPVCAAI